MTLIVDLYYKVNRPSPDNTQNYYSRSGLFSHRNPVIMRGVKEFLQSSTIHGLAYMATTDHKLTRLFWMLVVLSGFAGATYMIWGSDFCTVERYDGLNQDVAEAWGFR